MDWTRLAKLCWVGSCMLVLGLCSSSSTAFGQTLEGTVYRDHDNDGIRDGSEPGIANVEVTTYDASGEVVGSGTTDDDGIYALTLSVDQGVPIRVEIQLPEALAFLHPAHGGETAVQFVESGGTSIDAGFYNPAESCPPDPDLVTTCFVGGAHDRAGTLGDGAVVSFPSTVSKDANVYLARIGEVGSVYGLAYQRSTGRLFAGAFAKRHTDWGPEGPDAIYVIDTVTRSVIDSFQAVENGETPTPRGVDATRTSCDGAIDGASWNRDSCFFDAPGKEGLGDLELSDDDMTLWTIHLQSRHLYTIDVTPGRSTYGEVENLGRLADPGCPGGADDWRPFALEYHDGQLYVGGVCSGQTRNASPARLRPNNTIETGTDNIDDVELVVLRIDKPKTSAEGTIVLHRRGMGFARGKACGGSATACLSSTDHLVGRWHAWIGAWDKMHLYGGQATDATFFYYPQPMLTDLEIDADGSMILGVRDRFSDQVGSAGRTPGLGTSSDPVISSLEVYTASAGDLYRACFNRSAVGVPATAGTRPWVPSSAGLGGWVWEGEDLADDERTFRCDRPIVPPEDKPDTDVEEFYGADFQILQVGGPDWHAETAMGGLARQGAVSHVVTTVMDPIGEAHSAGVYFLDRDSGDQDPLHQDGYTVYIGAGLPEAGGLFGKAAGLGDLEYLCPPPPIRLGGRVWCDAVADSGRPNGIQDPIVTDGDRGLPGVTLSLWCDQGAVQAWAATDDTGVYAFDGSNVIGGVPPGSTCTVSLDTVVDSAALGACAVPTDADVGAHDLHDSDGLDPDGDGLVEAKVDVGAYGANDYSVDFGFQHAAHLDIPDRIPVAGDASIVVPVSLKTFGLEITDVAFHLEFDPDCMSVDSPDAVVSGDAESPTIGRIAISKNSGPTAFGDGDLTTLEIDGRCSPACDGCSAAAPYGADIDFVAEPTLANRAGDLAGVGTSGSITLYGGTRRDCDASETVDANDLMAHIGEIFDDDGSAWHAVAGGTFAGLPVGCDGNADRRVDAGDLSCLVRWLDGFADCGEGDSSRSGPPSRLVLGPPHVSDGVAVVRLALDPAAVGVTALVASLDLDTARFAFDPADRDGDAVPDAVRLVDKEAASLIVDWNRWDADGELDVAVVAAAATVASGLLRPVIIEIDVSVLEPATSGHLPFEISDEPAPSAGDLWGRRVPIEVVAANDALFRDGFESGDARRWSSRLEETTLTRLARR